MRRDGVPPKGSDVFKPSPDDKRPVYRIPVQSFTPGEITILRARFPGSLSGHAKPIRAAEVITAEMVHYRGGTLMPDPYMLGAD